MVCGIVVARGVRGGLLTVVFQIVYVYVVVVFVIVDNFVERMLIVFY